MDSRNCFLFSTTAEDSVVPDTHEAFRKNVHGKSPDEFFCLKRHGLVSAGILIVFIAEGYGVLREVKQAMIGDSNLVSVSPKVFDDLL